MFRIFAKRFSSIDRPTIAVSLHAVARSDPPVAGKPMEFFPLFIFELFALSSGFYAFWYFFIVFFYVFESVLSSFRGHFFGKK